MRTLRAAVIALVAALVLGGCSDGDDKPDSMATWTPSGKIETPTSEATPSDPSASLTVAPKGETAKQFIRRWIALGNRMQSTGDMHDIDAFLDVAGPDCSECHGFAEDVQRIYSAGGSVRGGASRATAIERESATQWVVTEDAEASEYTERAGGEIKTFPGGVSKSRLFLAKVDGRWIVGDTEGLS